MTTLKSIFLVVTVAFGAVGFMIDRNTSAAESDTLGDAMPAEQTSIFAKNCAPCHGMDGRARTAKGRRAGATDLTSDWNRDEARGIRIITNGKKEMPSFKGKLSPAEIRAVFGYVSRF